MGKRIRPAALGPTAIVLATGIVLAVNLIAPGTAEAQWWNPFNRPAETGATPSSRPPVPPADIGVAPPAGAAKQNVPAAGAPGYLNAVPPPVATAAPPPPAAAAPLDPTVRMERIEAQMRSLTGQIEQLNYQLNQLRDELRGTATLATATGGLRSADTAPPTARRTAADPPAVGGDPIGATIQGAPPRSLGTLPAATSDGPINLAALAAGQPGTTGAPPSNATAAPQVAAVAPTVKTGSSKNDYDVAYQHILAGEYAEAEKGLRAFLAAYPDDKLAADAAYWLGDSLFERSLFRDAAEEFVNGYKAYPKSGKAPDTLLKLGLSLKGLGERDAACQTYAKLLKDYPTITNVMVQRVKQEQKIATC